MPAETVRALTTAATLLEHVNTLIDQANERQSRRAAIVDDEKTLEEVADDNDQSPPQGFTVQRSDGEFPYQLVGPRVTIVGLAEQVAELDGTDRELSKDAPPWPVRAIDALCEAGLAVGSIQGICFVSLADLHHLPDPYRGVIRAVQTHCDLIEKHLDECQRAVRGLK